MKEIINVTKSSMPSMAEYIDEISSVWDNHWLTNMGEKHQELEKRLKDYLNVKNIQLVVNGHMALEIVLQAMELQGEVITTPFTFASTTHAIVRSGLTPVFCDINENDYTIDTKKIEALITKNTCAILPVHVYGNICDVYEIEKIAKKHNLKVIYDAAHTFGETIDGIGIGNFGDASCFSFHATKVFNTIEGGAITFKDNTLGEKIYNLKNFGIKNEENVEMVGANAKMNEFCAAMGLCNLRHIDEEIFKRKKIVERYRENLKDIEGIKLVSDSLAVKNNYSYFPVLFDEEMFGVSRDVVYEKLADNGIIARKYFYPITNSFSAYKGEYNPELTPVAQKISMQVLTLPLYADLGIDIVDNICDLILEMNKKCK